MIRFRLLVGLWLIPLVAAGVTLRAAPPARVDRPVEVLLPPSTIAYAHAPRLGAVVRTAMDHPLRQELEALPAYRSILESPQFTKLRQTVEAFEAALDMPWQEAVDRLTDGGVTLALDGESQGVAVLIASNDPKLLGRLHNFVLAIRQLSGSAKPERYEGFTAYDLGQRWRMAIVHQYLLITNQPLLGKTLIDRYRSPEDPSESSEPSELFAAIRESDDRSDLVAYVDLDAIRRGRPDSQLLQGRTDNPLAELLVGGLISNLTQASYARGSVDVAPESIAIDLQTPHDPQWHSPREYFFGEPELAAAPPLLTVPRRLAAISAHRDLAQMWLRASDLMSEQASEQLAKADSQLITLFSGRDFGEDILGSFEPGLQLVSQSPVFVPGQPVPAVQLPAFALQMKMRNPEDARDPLRRVFQSLMGFLNVVGSMQGRAQLDLGSEQLSGASLYSATYIPIAGKTDVRAAPVEFNFSPTIAFRDDRFILSSTSGLARDLLSASDGGASAAVTGTAGVANTAIEVDAGSLQALLEANSEQLVAQNMLAEGHDLETARGEVGLLLTLVGLLQRGDLSLGIQEDQMHLHGEVLFDE